VPDYFSKAIALLKKHFYSSVLMFWHKVTAHIWLHTRLWVWWAHIWLSEHEPASQPFFFIPGFQRYRLHSLPMLSWHLEEWPESSWDLHRNHLNLHPRHGTTKNTEIFRSLAEKRGACQEYAEGWQSMLQAEETGFPEWSNVDSSQQNNLWEKLQTCIYN
jgi:hypothetical protein